MGGDQVEALGRGVDVIVEEDKEVEIHGEEAIAGAMPGASVVEGWDVAIQGKEVTGAADVA